jgi:hypothetical protein
MLMMALWRFSVVFANEVKQFPRGTCFQPVDPTT